MKVNKIDEVLEERGNNYGDYKTQALTSQAFKDIMRAHPNWKKLTPTQKESLDMIQHKIARTINGDANYIDSWTDIAGYALLVEKELSGS